MVEIPLDRKGLESIKASMEKLRFFGIEQQRITAIYYNALRDLEKIIDTIKVGEK